MWNLRFPTGTEEGRRLLSWERVEYPELPEVWVDPARYADLVDAPSIFPSPLPSCTVENEETRR